MDVPRLFALGRNDEECEHPDKEGHQSPTVTNCAACFVRIAQLLGCKLLEIFRNVFTEFQEKSTKNIILM